MRLGMRYAEFPSLQSAHWACRLSYTLGIQPRGSPLPMLIPGPQSPSPRRASTKSSSCTCVPKSKVDCSKRGGGVHISTRSHFLPLGRLLLNPGSQVSMHTYSTASVGSFFSRLGKFNQCCGPALLCSALPACWLTVCHAVGRLCVCIVILCAPVSRTEKQQGPAPAGNGGR
ncbi:hypothetical protein BD289DRAFT_120852 [Coniella lustricola]|uniref:Uncharacterized protein n=1 Tax=Coniella lustricola TaxID=2025994 RepID=A0A2T2ZWR2_9PEZI|nr:hypothetical protein BD289DRAFT_120852 [Coniella lustricola]